MNEIELPTAELPEAVRAWLETQSAVVVSIERSAEGYVLVRSLPEVSAEFVARVGVTMAKYREALMNLT